MDTPSKQRFLQLGLTQIPTEGLVRLRDHLDAGRPIITESAIVANRDGRGRAYG